MSEVHEAGGRIIPQLWHVGAMRNPKQDLPNPDLPAISPSGMYKPGAFTGSEMSRADITAVIDAFAQAARSARELGFDGVEIHGAHGYIFDQFLWGELNLRSDEYGGGAVDRTRFLAETIRAVRGEVGSEFPVILRISQWKQQDYDARLATRPEELGAILQPLADAGVSLFHCSQRRYWEPEFDGSPMNLAGWVKKLTGRPTITVGSVGLSAALSIRDIGEEANVVCDLTPLARAVARGEYDLVAVGRAMLADPEWVMKVREQRLNELCPFERSALDTLW